MADLIDRQAAIDALWKALYDYEDKTEKQFKESDALDVGDWIEHRIFVQNMSDIDRQTILNLPTAQPEPSQIARDIATIIENEQDMRVILKNAQPEIIRCKDCEHLRKWRSKESAKKFGQIYECARNVLNCPKLEDFCSHAERRQNGGQID